MTDIADRLAKLSKWDELAKRAQMERAASARGDASRVPDAPFREAVEAVGRIVRRHSGMAVVLMSEGAADGLDDLGTAVRVAEQCGDFVVEPVVSVEWGVTKASNPGNPYPGNPYDLSNQHSEVNPGESAKPVDHAPSAFPEVHRAPERLTAELARLLRHNPGLLSGWPAHPDRDESPVPGDED